MPLRTLAVPELVTKKRRLPWLTPNVSVVVAVSAALPLSGSAMLMPEMKSSVFSGMAAMLAGSVTVGVSLTGVILIVAVSDALDCAAGLYLTPLQTPTNKQA